MVRRRRAFASILFREIRKSPGRYASIVLIVFLGAGFFAGVRATCPDMERTCDAWLDASNCQDLSVVSVIGFTGAEVAAIGRIPGVEAVEPSCAADVMATIHGGEKAVKVLSLPSSESGVSRPRLVAGRYPRDRSECLAEPGNLQEGKVAIGDTISFRNAQGEWRLTVSGIAASPLYVSWNRGSNSLGDGSTHFYFMADRELALDMYLPVIHWPSGPETARHWPEVEVRLSGAKALDSFGPAYRDLVDAARKRIAAAGRELTGSDRLWYVLDRDMNAGIRGFSSDAERIGKVGEILPVVFFLVAALVSLASMTRLVEEDRGQIGTLKALGYGGASIVGLYLLYAASATLIGGIGGVAVGFALLPRLIYSMYRLMYSVGPLASPFLPSLAMEAVVAALACTVAGTLGAGLKELLSGPAALMRPKAPRPGKRVLLERVPAIWKRLDFTRKVTVRNLFRYKQRLAMTLAGIAGCTALLVTGFGLSDSLAALTHRQFGEIYHYDLSCELSQVHRGAEALAFEKSLALGDGGAPGVGGSAGSAGIKNALLVYEQGCSIASGRGGRRDLEATIAVPRDPRAFSEYVTLKDGKKPLALPGEGLILTRKASELLGLKAGEKAELVLGNKKASVVVAGITEQYVLHFAYLSPEALRKAFGSEPGWNQMLALDSSNSQAFESALGARLMAGKEVKSLMFTSSANRLWDDTMKNMNYIILVIIVSAGLLAFVVIYNLTNINVIERTKELATIKVLGFRKGEMASYIYRENTFLTLLGTLIGLVLGIFLHRYVVLTSEVDVCMFGRDLSATSFLWSALLTLGFSGSVNLFMYRRLTGVDMVEAMKSVD